MDSSFFNIHLTQTSFQDLMKEIGEAIRLDDENQDKEAYVKYSSCIYRIASNLLHNSRVAGWNFTITPNVSRQVKLLQQCVDRVNSLVQKMEKDQAQDSNPSLTPKTASIQQKSSMVPKNSYSLNEDTIARAEAEHFARTLSPIHRMVRTVSDVSQNPELERKSLPTLLNVPSISENNPYMYNKTRTMSPLEKAHAQNKSLIIAYKARMKRLNKSNFSAYNYSLTLQRKMAENLAIAKAQEEELAKKMKARQERLEEEAARRFAHPTDMTLEEKEYQQLYKSILDYENDVEWLSKWRQKLASNREDPVLICQAVQEILRCSDHPFTQMLRKLQFKVHEQLYPLVTDKHANVDLIKVALPRHLWPTLEEVLDIVPTIRMRTTTSPAPEVRKRKKIRSKGKLSTGSDINAESSKPSSGDDDNSKEDTRVRDSDDRYEQSKYEEGSARNVGSDDNSNQGEGDNDKGLIPEEEPGSSSSCNEQPSPVRPLGETNVSSERDDGRGIGNEECCNRSGQGDDSEKVDVGVDDDPKVKERVDNAEAMDTGVYNDNEMSQDDGTKSNSEIDAGHDGSSDVPIGCHGDAAAIVSENSHCDDGDNGSGSCSSCISGGEESDDPRHNVMSAVSYTNIQLREACDKGRQTESELTLQRKQARLLMQQISRDYDSFDAENFDDLFDDDDDDDDANSNVAKGYGSGVGVKSDEVKFASVENSSKNVVSADSMELGDKETETENGVSILRRSQSSQLGQSSLQPDPIHETMFSSLPPSINNVPAIPSPFRSRPDNQNISQLDLEAYERHLRGICNEIHLDLDKLLQLMIVAYEALDTPVGKDQCAVALEEPFFKPIWKTLLRLFRVVNHKRETVMACVMTSYRDARPETLKVREKFCLASPGGQGKPYQEAIDQLLKLPQYYTVLSKLDCIVQVCRLICECVDTFYSDENLKEKRKASPVLGADDLVPVLTYVIVSTGCPQLVSECQAMTEFIAEGYMMGEEGYCLTTFRTAMEYLLSLFTPLKEE